MKHDTGNALFLILMAVGLLAALSYAVTQSTRGPGNADREQRELALAEVLNHFSAVERATKQLILTTSCTDLTIRFWHEDRPNAGSSSWYGNGSNPSCQVYHPEGGSGAYDERPDFYARNGTIGSDEYMIYGQRILYVGSDANRSGHDLVIMANLDRESCISANKKFGVENPSGDPPFWTSSGNDWLSPGLNYLAFPSHLTGDYTNGHVIIGQWAGQARELAGRPTGCFWKLTSDSKPYYILYHTIFIR